MYTFWQFFIRNARFSYLFLIALVGFGFYSVFEIPKESAPEVQIPVAIVSTALPGASAFDVEKLITNKIEEQLNSNISEINDLTSSSREGLSVIVAEFDASADLDESIDKVKDEVDTVTPELPDDATDPQVSEVNFVDQPVMTIGVSGDLPPSRFAELADAFESELKSVQGVSKVNIAGLREKEVQVITDRESLVQFGLSISDVVSAIATANNTLPVGSVRVNDIAYNVAFEGDVDDPAEIADIPVANVGGQPVYVRDVAFVSNGIEDETTRSRVSLGGTPSQPALSFDVFKSTGGDVTAVSRDVRTKLEGLQEPGELLDTLEVLVLLDNGELVVEDLVRLSLTGLQTVILVMIILLISIGWRESLIAGAAIPTSFLIAFIGLNASGNTINFVSLFSLILAVGILVDSAIVMVEGINRRMKADRNIDKTTAALQTIKEYNVPLTAGTMTTIAMFSGLFLVSGVTGEFIASIPFTIVFVLLASLIVALGIVPLFASLILRRRSQSKLEQCQEKYARQLEGWYERQIRKVLGNRKRENWFLASIILGLFIALSFPITGIVKVIFFEQSDIDWIYAEVELPQGSSLDATDIEARKVEEILYQEDRIESFVTTIGQSSAFSNSGASTDNKLANMFITLRDDRKETSTEIVEDLERQVSGITSSIVRISQPSDGPPVGTPIVITFAGDDLDVVKSLAEGSARILESLDNTQNVVTSTKDDAIEFVLKLDKAKATALGLNPNVISQTLRAAVNGIEATEIKTQGEDIDVVVKMNLNENYRTPQETAYATLDDIALISVATPNGSVLLGSVLDTSIDRGTAVIRHDDLDRIATAGANITSEGNVREINAEFERRAREELDIPEGTVMRIGGENEETDQSFKEMFLALIVGMILMLAILVLQFNSYRHAFYVLSILPFSLIGIFIGLAISQLPLSFPSIMGFIALSGIVVNNSIILIDVINELRKKFPHRETEELVIEGTKTRLRPILLTTLTTVIGIIPLTYASELWSPLAFAIMFGLSFSVIITLMLVPILYRRKPGDV